MCLISCYPKSTSKDIKIVKEFLTNSFNSNGDGHGFMYKINGHKTVNFKKGYRDIELMLKDIEALNLKDDDELITHGRIGTSGERNDVNMHPFVVTNNFEALCKLSGRVSYPVMCHNGYFIDYTDHNSKFSDTWHFVYEFAGVPEITALLKRDSDLFQEMFGVSHIKRTKLAFLFPERDMLMIGDFTEDDGYFHSNGGYKKYEYNYGGFSTRSKKSKNTILADEKSVDYYFDEEAYYSEHFGYPKLKPSVPIIDLSKLNIMEFTNKQITLTEDNYKHFWLVPTTDSFRLNKGCQYSIDSFRDTDDIFYILKSGEHVLDGVDKTLLEDCRFFVKEEFKARYKGFYNLIKVINSTNGPTRSMLKKLRNLTVEKKGKECNNYRNYGIVYLVDVNAYLQYFTDVEEAFVSATSQNASVGAQFTLNETQFANIAPVGDVKALNEFIENLQTNEDVVQEYD